MKLSRTEVHKRVPMSLATFDRWRKAGKLETFTDGTLSNAKKQIVWVTLEALGKALGISDEMILRLRLGLPERTPEPVIKHDVPINRNYEDAKPTPDIREPDAFSPKEAEPYRDSFGHTISGNREHRMFESQPYTPINSTAHMNPALINSGARIENPIDSDAFTDLWRKPGEPTSAERHKLQGKEVASQHPNANRQAYLRAIRPTGYSR
jgi:hypothetical protein